MAGVSAQPHTFFRIGPADTGQAQCFAVRRGELQGGSLSAPLHSPSSRAFFDSLRGNPATNKLLRDYVDFNPPIDLSGLQPDDAVSFIPMDAVADGATGEYAAADRPLSEVSKGYTRFRNGDILWAKITPCMQNGKSCIVEGLTNGVGFGSTEFHVLRVRNPKISSRFVLEFVSQASLRQVATYAFTGSAGQQRVPAEFLANLPFPELSEARQTELVALMDAARAERRSRLAEADGLLAGVDGYLREALGLAAAPAAGRRVFAVRQGAIGERMDAWFNNPRYDQLNARLDAMPVPTAELGELLLSISSGATPSRNNQSLYADAGIKFLRILNIDNGEITETDMKYITDAVHNGELNRSQLAADDVLMTITGRVGSAAVVQAEHLPANINQHIVRMRIDQTRCRPEFLSLWLNSKDGLELANRYVSGGTRAALDYQAIRKIRIPLPATLAEQDAIIGHVSAVRQQAATLRTEAETGWQAAREGFEGAVLGHQR